jgi:hypothetical protein
MASLETKDTPASQAEDDITMAVDPFEAETLDSGEDEEPVVDQKAEEEEEEVFGLDEDGPRMYKVGVQNKTTGRLEDGIWVELSVEDLKLSSMMSACIEGDQDSDEIPLGFLGFDRILSRDEDEEKVVRLSPEEYKECQRRTLADVAEYLKHYSGCDVKEMKLPERPIRSQEISENSPTEWDAAFMNKVKNPRLRLFHLTLAANYLDIKPLLHLCAATLASFIKGKELRDIETDLNPRHTDAQAAVSTSAASSE